MISVPTRRFGTVERETKDVLTFPSGIFGFELNMRWLLLGDRAHGALYWLQNVEDVDLSFPVVEPREFVEGYTLEIQQRQLASVSSGNEALLVLSVLTEYEGRLCLNLRNPIVINPSLMLGGQFVAADDRSLQHALPAQTSTVRKTA